MNFSIKFQEISLFLGRERVRRDVHFGQLEAYCGKFCVQELECSAAAGPRNRISKRGARCRTPTTRRWPNASCRQFSLEFRRDTNGPLLSSPVGLIRIRSVGLSDRIRIRYRGRPHLERARWNVTWAEMKQRYRTRQVFDCLPLRGTLQLWGVGDTGPRFGTYFSLGQPQGCPWWEHDDQERDELMTYLLPWQHVLQSSLCLVLSSCGQCQVCGNLTSSIRMTRC